MKDGMTYRGICPHGKVRFMAVDEPDVMRAHANDIAAMLKAGFTIDRVTGEEARKSDMNCEPCDLARQKRRTRRGA